MYCYMKYLKISFNDFFIVFSFLIWGVCVFVGALTHVCARRSEVNVRPSSNAFLFNFLNNLLLNLDLLDSARLGSQ